ncbi:MAG: LysM peptidoglycan-binding domain-containing protein, partial [Bradyrhizobium sp.]
GPVRPRQSAGFLAAALLAASFCLAPQPAAATPVAAMQRAGVAPPRELRAGGAPNPLSVAPVTAPAIEPPHGRAGARVYLFRGALGPIFSRGMDGLGAELRQAGIPANVYEFTRCDAIAETAMATYQQNPAPIVLIGHSMGGRCALQFAEKLQVQDIPVSLLVTIDPAHLSPNVPLNVERFINIFLANSILGGGNIQPARGFQGHFASYDLSQYGGVWHITIDKIGTIHRQLVAKIVGLAATPATAEGEPVPLPLRYVVPPRSKIELWDSGMAVAAHAGDTLRSLATEYQVPLWSLAQANPIADSGPLTAGQQIVVPRHLLPPLTAVATPSSAGQLQGATTAILQRR